MSDTTLLPNGLIKTLRAWEKVIELIYNTAKMRHFQKKFFREKDSPKLKNEYLIEAKKYEKEVDEILDILWPQEQQTQQTNLFHHEKK